MKNPKKILALLLAVVMVLAMAAPALAYGTDPNDGSITITNTKIGETYTLYKMFDLTYVDTDNDGEGDAVSYIASKDVHDAIVGDNDAKKLFTFTLIPDSNPAEYTVALADGVVDADVIQWLNSLYDGEKKELSELGKTILTKIGDPVKASSQTVKFEGLAYGYYFVTSSLGAIVTVDSTMKNVSVVDKNTKQRIEKYIIADDENPSKEVKYDSVEVGETVTFKIIVPLYQYTDGEGDGKVEPVDITEYYVFDNLEDGPWSYNNDLTATISGDANTTTFVKDTNYTVSAADPYDFIVTIPIQKAYTDAKDIPEGSEKEVGDYYEEAEFLYENNAVVTFTYTATLTEQIDATAGDYENRNDVTLKWTVKEDDVDDVTTPEDDSLEEDEPTDHTISYSTDIQLIKIDGQTSGKLTGAKFKLEGTSEDMTITTGVIFAPYSKTKKVNNEDVVLTDADGVEVQFKKYDATSDSGKTKYWLVDGAYVIPETPGSDDTAYVQDGPKPYWMLKPNAEGDTLFTATDPATLDTDATNYDELIAKYDDLTKTYMKVTKVEKNTVRRDVEAEAYVDENGSLIFKGLDEGEYTITELVAPAGYNLLSEPIYVKIVLENLDKDGKVIPATDTTTEVASHGLVAYRAVKDSNDAIQIAKWDDTNKKYVVWASGDAEADKAKLTDSASDKIVDMKVANNKGTELPSTGGIGTTIFIAVGALVMVGAGVFFVTNQRMRKEGF